MGLPLLVKTVVPIFFGKEEDASPWVVEHARHCFGDDYSEKLLLMASVGMPHVFLLRGVSNFTNRYLINHAGFVALEGLRKEVFKRLQHLPMSFYHRHKSDDLVSRLITDTEQLRQTIILVSVEIIKQPATLLFAFGYLVYLAVTQRSPLITMLTLVSIPACVFPIYMVGRRLARKSRIIATQSGELAAVVTETLQSPMEIQAYNLQQQ